MKTRNCRQILALLFTALPALAGTIGSTLVTPAATPAGTAAVVTVTSVISDASVIAGSVQLQSLDSTGRVIAITGNLHDDGLNGDAVANDGTYTLQTTVLQNTPGTLIFRVSAGFQGSLTRAFSSQLLVSVTGSSVALNILSPANLLYTSTSPVIVSGTVGDSSAAVKINGINAPVTGGQFQASVPLAEGLNTLTAVATNTGGAVSTASVQATLDTTPPHITIDSPQASGMTTAASVTVTGTANDIVVGTVNSGDVQVSINGIVAQVANRTYAASNVPLVLGANTLQAVGRDRAGNGVTITTTITRVSASQPMMPQIGMPAVMDSLNLVSGNNQTGMIATALSSPLIVALTDQTGKAVTGQAVVFTVTGNNGTLTAGGTPAAAVMATTDSNGKAQVTWTLGQRSGAGIDTVQASTALAMAVVSFNATALTSGANMIVADSGNNQSGALGQALTFPFVAVVTDSGHNRVPNVQVTFNVVKGGGKLGGALSQQVTTDSNGRAIAVLTLGSQPGNAANVVQAGFSGNPGLPISFTATGLASGDPGNTSISGVVLDNGNLPLQGVTMRLYQTNQASNNNLPLQVGTPVQTDAKGAFTILAAPVGYFKLMADGTTAVNLNSYPVLEYDIVTVAGQNNKLPGPVYLPALDKVNQLCVDATHGGTLTLPQSPGFALKVLAGSAIFPGGSTTGCVSVSTVNADKVPMAPGFGQQPRYIVTIQPVGTVFNPPAAISIPNVDGLAANAVTEMYSYDHDLSEFIAIGTGTVSKDGSVIASNPGVGVLKAGWHCGGNPSATGGSGGLAVTMTPLVQTTMSGNTASLTASGTPPLEGTYSWQLTDDPADADDDPTAGMLVTQPACLSAPSCTATVKGLKPGRVTVKVTFTCTTTGLSVSTTAKINFTLALNVTEVSFQNPNKITLFKDLAGSAPVIAGPEWVDANIDGNPETDEPAAFVGSKPGAGKMSLTAKFKVTGTTLPADVSMVKIRGNSAGLNFVAGAPSIAAGVVSIPLTASTENLPATTKYYNPLTIVWQYSTDGGATYTNAGSSSHKVFVTLGVPTQSKVYVTTIQYAVSNDGAGDQGTAFQKSWDLIKGPANIKTWDARKLYYYRDGYGFGACALDEASLLTAVSGSGQCGSFANLLIAVASTNAIPAEFIVISTVDRTGFLVKKWTFGTASYPGAAGAYEWKLAFNPLGDVMVPKQASGVYGDLTNTDQLAGQNSAPPSEKAFGLHFIVKTTVNPPTLYYDASYGGTYTGADKVSAAAFFEANAVEGYYKSFAADPANERRLRVPAGAVNIVFDK